MNERGKDNSRKPKAEKLLCYKHRNTRIADPILGKPDTSKKKTGYDMAGTGITRKIIHIVIKLVLI